MERARVATSTKITDSRVITRTSSKVTKTTVATKVAREIHTSKIGITKTRTGRTMAAATVTLTITAMQQATMGSLLLGATDELSTIRSTTAVAVAVVATKTDTKAADAGTKSLLTGFMVSMRQAKPTRRNC